VVREIPKVAFAGWFLEGQDFLFNLHKLFCRSLAALQTINVIWKRPWPTKTDESCVPILNIIES